MRNSDIVDTVIAYIEVRLEKLERPPDARVPNAIWSSAHAAATELREVLEMMKKLKEK